MEVVKRGIVEGPHDVVFPLCFLEEEDVEHLFGFAFFLILFGPSCVSGLEWTTLSLRALCWIDSMVLIPLIHLDFLV